jgi:hypothetical protein
VADTAVIGAPLSDVVRVYPVARGSRHRRWTPRFAGGAAGKEPGREFLLWIIAVVLVIVGIVYLIRREVLLGIVLIVVGLLVGPGGVSIFT